MLARFMDSIPVQLRRDSMSAYFTRSLTVAGVALALGASVVVAQTPPRAGRGMGMMMHYDKSTEVTVAGTVEAVETMPRLGGGRGPGMAMGGTHLTFKTATETFDVHLGPSAWLADQKFDIATGDTLTIVGSTVTVNGEKALIAREITKGDRKITLRDADGFPAWAGWGRRSQS
jgi:hypothetical protein